MFSIAGISKDSLSNFISNNKGWLEKQQSSIFSAAIIITVANVVSSIAGLLRQRLLIAYFFNTPTSREAFEALLVAFQIPDMMFQLIVLGAVSAAFIPTFSELKKKDKNTAFDMASSVMNILLLVFVLISAVVFIFANPLTAWRTGAEFSNHQIEIAANLTRIMLLAQLFFGISNIFSAMLQSFQRFILPSISPILYNIGILIGVYLFAPSMGIYSAGLGVCFGAFLHMVIQLPLILKLGFRFKLKLSTKIAGVKQMLKLVPARVMTIGLGEIQNLGLGFFATSLGGLSFVIIKLATSLMTIPIRLFGVPISQASLPFLSEESTEKGLERFRNLVTKSLHQIAFFAYPASVLLLILRLPAVRLIFGTHNFPWQTTLSTSRVVAIIAISITAQAMVQLFIRAFYALKDTTTPLIITAITVLLYVLGSGYAVFYSSYGVLGIAFVTSLVAIIELLMFAFYFDKKISNFINKDLIIPQLKIISASFLMAVFLYLPYRVLDELIFNTTKTVELIALTVVTGTIGMLVYAFFAYLFEISELKLIAHITESLKKWQKPLAKTQEVLVDPSIEDDSV